MANSDSLQTPSTRLFIGIKIEPSKEILRIVEELKSDLDFAKIKWSIPENYHLTLWFMGSTPDYLKPSIIKCITLGCKDISPFNLELSSAGYFGRSKPKVLWIGVNKNRYLSDLYTQIHVSLNSSGLVDDTPEKFNPHITIGRIKQVESVLLNNVVERFDNRVISSFRVTKVHLYKSVSEPEGVKYYILNSQELV